MGRAVGIDLGSTNSAVAVFDAGVPVVISNSEGERTTPSVVAFSKAGEVLVGEGAKRQAITNPDRTFRSIKRVIGESWESDFIDGRMYTAQEISARTLMKLKRDAESFLDETVTDAVITVPAYFDDAQRTATKEAGQIAGLNVVRLLTEPSAAALAYRLDKGSEDEMILVFDLGGGTFDVSVLEIGEGVFEVKSTHGDTNLGGDDWDQRIIDWLISQFKNAQGVDLSSDRMAMQRLKEAAERAKIELSQIQSTQINLPFITANADGPLHLDETLSRSKFQEMTSDLIERCRVPFEQALKDAGVSKGDLDDVILVGGSTRMPAVTELVQTLTGKEPNKTVNPDEVVAVGAAVKAGVLRGDVKDVLLLDVTPLSLGIETKGGVMTRLIERNTTIPTRRTEVFTTAEDKQPTVEIHVLQGERQMAAHNKTLGKFQLVDLPPAPRGVPQIEVTFDIDANGIVHVSAKDRATNKEQSMTATGRHSLGHQQIRRMRSWLLTEQDRDRQRHEQSEARNEAHALLGQIEKMLRVKNDQVSADERAAVDAPLHDLRAALDGSDIGAITSATEALRREVQTWNQRRRVSAETVLQRRIFISYRREDTEADAGRLYSDLEREFGRERIFKDVDDVPLGASVRRRISDAIAESAVVVVLVGPNWRPERMAGENDWVRVEIELALEFRVPIIPVRLRRAELPMPSDIPESVRELCDLNAAELEHASWKRDMQPLLSALRRLVDPLS